MSDIPQPRASWSVLFQGRYLPITLILNIGIGLHAVDVFIISAVMPSVVKDIGGTSFYTWSTTLYMVATIFGNALGAPVKQALGARLGYGLAGIMFLIGTAGCGVAPVMAVLLIARFIQGFGGGLLIAQGMGLVREVYPAHLRTQALALISGIWGVAAVVGPVIGGEAVALGQWRYAFFATLPLIAAFTLAAFRYLPAAETGRTAMGRIPYRRLGLLGAGAIALAFADQTPVTLWQVLLLTGGIAAIVGAFLFDRFHMAPLFPPQLTQPSHPIALSGIAFVLQSITHTAVGIILPLALQQIHDMSPRHASYFTGILALCWTLASFTTARWRDGREHYALFAGPILTAIAMFVLAAGIVDLPIFAIAIAVGAVGFGVGASNLHLTAMSLSAAPKGEEARTAGAIPTMRTLGIAVGSALVGVIANNAGLRLGIDPVHVASAAGAVYGVAAFAPLVTLGLMIFFFAQVRRSRMINAEAALVE